MDKAFDEPSSARAARAALTLLDNGARPGLDCLVTGCALIDPNTDRVVWGDLHALDNVGIFNACPNPHHESSWVEVTATLDTTLSCTLAYDQQFFERRAVIVFDLTQATLNRAAQQRMVPRG